ncbi:ATP-dependent DNA helicase II subunit 1 [[Candida] jaroonii]|uniref:ATP-dependent DNA helicase II subunit 1 n=1 Tax=[Candida] jaroonii TaxID=467808 RepID=A0ACA9Y8M6_9ASCO|nr:ATP-dependent DNA helicase II subunit 1 [[Candida] jaroonii]
MEEEEDFKQYDIRDGIIFLIEINESIFQSLKELNGKNQLFEIISSIDDLLQDMIIILPNTGVGIYLYNCESEDNSYNLKKISGLHDLSSTKMKYIHDLVTDDIENRAKLPDLFKVGNNNENNLPKVLTKIIDQFDKSHYKTRKLVWFTNNDQPFESKNVRDSLHRIIEDYEDRGIQINPIFLNKQSNDFDISKYRDIFSSTGYLNNYKNSTIVSEKIKNAIIRLKEIKRIQFACNLILSDGKLSGNLGISIKGYTLYNQEKLTKTRNLYYHDNKLKLVETESTIKNEAGEEITLATDDKKSAVELKYDAGIKSGIELNDEEKTILHLGPQQWEFLKNYAFDNNPDNLEDSEDDEDNDDETDSPNTDISPPPYLKLLGFRHIDKFTPFYNLSPPAFITGDYFNGKNSTYGYTESLKTMSLLYKSCIKLKRYAVVFGCTKRNSLPSLYALYPTNLPRSTKSQNFEFPHGFLLVKLPWLEDIRSLPESVINDDMRKFPVDNKNANPRELVDLYKKLVDSHRWEHFNPNAFPNPVINYHYKILKHNLLQIPFEEDDKLLKNNDSTYPVVEKIFETFKKGELQEISEYITQYLNKFDNLDTVREYNNPAKRQKVDDSLTLEQVLTGWKSGELNSFTVSQLKSFARSQKITMGNKKDVLIENINAFLNAKEKNLS